MGARCPGFRFAGVGCGVKASGALDLGVIACDGTASAAAVFTQNRMAAAPVKLSKKALSSSGGKVSSVVVNSGNANACTGPDGARDARAMQKRLAAKGSGDLNRVLVASTGVIGVRLPMEKIHAGVDAAAASLNRDGFGRFSRAILTTDRGPKTARRKVKIGASTVTLIGCTKGAGMIAPNMATTLSFVVTDAEIAPRQLSPLLGRGCEQTFNAITVDGDTSTNDMILVLASGASNTSVGSRKKAALFGAALTELLDELATKLMRDGEGVNHVAKVVVRGARDSGAARRVARAIAISPLVKTAIAGCDPNWGRILCAAGNAGVALTPSSVSLDIGPVPVVRDGVVVEDWARAERRAAAIMKRGAYTITLDLARGEGTGHYLACDLSHEYVRINADYRT